MKRHLLAATLVLLTAANAALACPTCKDSLPNKEGSSSSLRDSYDSGGQNISGGINASVYVMLLGLAGTIGVVSTVIVKGMRSAPHRVNPTPPPDRAE